MIEINQQSRCRLYYDRYRYGICLYVPHAGLLRQLDHDMIDEVIDYRNQRNGRWDLYKITSNQGENLHQLCDVLLSAPESMKKICYSNHVYLYSNDLNFLESISAHSAVVHLWTGEAIVDQPSGVIVKKNSVFRFRTFFCERYLSQQDMAALTNFLQQRTDRYCASPTVRNLVLAGRRRYLRSYYFVDHRDQNDLLLLSLAIPDLIRKTVPIQTK